MLKWNLPSADEPGYLKRRREVSELLDMLPTPENTDLLIEYLSQFVEGDIEEASQNEYNEAVLVLLGLASGVSNPKEESSVQP